MVRVTPLSKQVTIRLINKSNGINNGQNNNNYYCYYYIIIIIIIIIIKNNSNYNNIGYHACVSKQTLQTCIS